MRTLPIIALALLFAPSVALADTSTICVWGLLAEGHAQLEACGDSLSPDAEARYAALRAAAETAIIANAKLGPGQTQDTVRSGLAATDRAYRAKLAASAQTLKTGLCAQSGYGQVKSIVQQLTAASTFEKTMSGLRTPRDPFVGDCL